MFARLSAILALIVMLTAIVSCAEDENSTGTSFRDDSYLCYGILETAPEMNCEPSPGDQ